MNDQRDNRPQGKEEYDHHLSDWPMFNLMMILGSPFSQWITAFVWEDKMREFPAARIKAKWSQSKQSDQSNQTTRSSFTIKLLILLIECGYKINKVMPLKSYWKNIYFILLALVYRFLFILFHFHNLHSIQIHTFIKHFVMNLDWKMVPGKNKKVFVVVVGDVCHRLEWSKSKCFHFGSMEMAKFTKYVLNGCQRESHAKIKRKSLVRLDNMSMETVLAVDARIKWMVVRWLMDGCWMVEMFTTWSLGRIFPCPCDPSHNDGFVRDNLKFIHKRILDWYLLGCWYNQHAW